MAIKKYNPTTPARRSMTVSTFEEITKKSPERNLVETIKGAGDYEKSTLEILNILNSTTDGGIIGFKEAFSDWEKENIHEDEISNEKSKEFQKEKQNYWK